MPDGAFLSLVANRRDHSQAWSDDLTYDEGLKPEADFRDWSLGGLARVPSR